MEFYEFITTYELMKKEHPDIAKQTPEQFYGWLMRKLQLENSLTGNRDAITAFNQSQCDVQWLKLEKPYYKIFPKVIPMFTNTKLDVPAHYLKAPFKAFEIRFPKGHKCPDITTKSGAELRNLLIHAVEAEDVIQHVNYQSMFIVWLNFGESVYDYPFYIYQAIKIQTNDTVEDALLRQQTPENTDYGSLQYGIDIEPEVITNAIRLMVSICFLATGADKIIEPDVLSKDLQKYIEAKKNGNHDKIKTLTNKAKKRKKKGWTIGSEVSLFKSASQGSDNPGTGQQLTYQHQRQWHFHVVRYGPGKSFSRVQLYRPVTVRPDLPLPPFSKKGYFAK